MTTQQAPIGSAPPNANRISIITKSEIRYEGILYHINPQDQNITLCNVKSFGTEGRRPGDEIAPSPQIHEYIIFRGTDIKDLKVLEAAPQQEAAPTENVQKQAPETSAPKPKETGSQEIKMKGQDEEFDFQAMQQKFQQFALDHKQPDIQTNTYKQDDFFDSLSTSVADKGKDQAFDRIAQKKLDKETFGPEYVDNASRGRGGYRRGGGRGRGGNYRGGGRGGNYRGGYGGGQNRNYEGQDRNYGGQGGYGGGHGGQGGYGGGQGGYGGGQGGYGGQNRKYGGGQGGHGGQGGYGGGHGGQGGYRGGHGGQGGYGGGQGGYGGQHGGQQGGRGGYNSGPRYYKTYQTVDHNQDQEPQEK